jgi:hypothetical protein
VAGTGIGVVGAEVAAVASVVATAEVVASVKPRRVPRVALRAVTVPHVAAVTGEASAGVAGAVAVSAARPAPWWS